MCVETSRLVTEGCDVCVCVFGSVCMYIYIENRWITQQASSFWMFDACLALFVCVFALDLCLFALLCFAEYRI